MTRTAAVIGTGLIGASVGLALRAVAWRVVGWDTHPDALDVALARGALDEAADSEAEAVDGADLVVLAGPLSSVLASLATLETDALITDVAGVKEPVVAAARPDLRFIGGHPMAGREHAGPAAATPALFRGAAWILTPNGADPADVEELTAIVESVGAVAVEMAADAHDRAVAAVSHLPHVLATSLVNRIAGHGEAWSLAAGSFRDLTRVAASDPGFWPEVLVANHTHVVESLDELIDDLASVRTALLADDQSGIADRLARAQQLRRDLAPPVMRIRVILQDKPGELAAVGHALQTSAVDVRDLQLRHAPHGGGGVLTLSVRPGEAEPLRDALAAEGFAVE